MGCIDIIDTYEYVGRYTACSDIFIRCVPGALPPEPKLGRHKYILISAQKP